MRIVKRYSILVAMIVMSVITPNYAYPNTQVADLQSRIYDIFEANRQAIVKVYASKKVAANKTILDVGSGIIVAKTGAVMTSAFITRNAEKIWVEYNGKLIDAEDIGYDPITTVSIIKILGGEKYANLPTIKIDSSLKPAAPATLLMAISYEMGLPASPRLGMATGQNVEFGGRFLPTVHVRTNLPAPRGSIGGAVFTLDGKFAGMTIASVPEVAGSFVLPARAVAKICEDIVVCGEPVYSWFGLGANDKGKGMPHTQVEVTLVAENSPAKRAGFTIGDEILEINSIKVSNNTELRSQTFFVRPGETASFKVKRKGKILTLSLIADRMPNDIIKNAEIEMEPSITQDNVQNNNIDKSKDNK